MRPNIKIATCCYCGSRTMLKPTARDGHELACGRCGAPLHEMKWLKSPELSRPKPSPLTRMIATKSAAHSRKQRPRKPLWRRAIEEVWDEIEDIFD
ncbi:hypothetical protein [Litoreibacter janthinus]|uniref:TFIIB zinc-binding n=1 Tax=Litoreibacter janthinus TaxID=670154 RepID=A0A1I6GLW1_9RHOB|nr:hypothetical protein [Litoreibacter janthinus]SFR43212.1 hypothetical protein SAMN04488002_1690 [Litoreibacter janthinus]